MPYKDNAARRAAEAVPERRARLAQQARERRAADGGKSAAAAAARRAADPEKRQQQVRAAYYRDVEASRRKRREHYHANIERHREVARQAHAAVMLRDPESYRARVRARRAIERGAEGRCTASDWTRVLALYGGRCLRCGTDQDLTQDHVVPLVLGGTHWPWNTQPLCKSCNAAKGARHSTDYRPDHGAAIRDLLMEDQ